VNWNSGRHLAACLASIAAAELGIHRLGRVIVVDNASNDSSLERVPPLGLPLQVLVNRTNRGFAAACNQGAALGEAEFILFLNPDVVLEGRSLARPLDRLAAPESAGIGVCGIQLLDEERRVARSCGRLPRARHFWWRALGLATWRPDRFEGQRMLEWDHRTSACVDQVMGAFFLVRRRLFDALGGFDERFFLYFEEVDFSARLREAGYASLFLAEVGARHWGGGSSAQIEGLRSFYSLRSRWLYAAKHFSRGERASLAVATLVAEPIARLARAFWRASPAARNVVLAYGLLLRWLAGRRR
jgi:GT2 family glycosyltransferase